MAKARAKTTETKNKSGNGANLCFEAQLFHAADKLRGNLELSDYKHVALGLIFLKYIRRDHRKGRQLYFPIAWAVTQAQSLVLPIGRL